MYDLSTIKQKVNAANKNKTGMVEARASQRRNASFKGGARKECCRVICPQLTAQKASLNLLLSRQT
jgi:hypothetical protein